MEVPILIVGAGPTGLVLALWLAKRKIPFRLIEKNSGPGQASRAMVVQARTLEFYGQLGIASRIIDAGIKMKRIQLREGARKVAGFSFGDIGLDLTPYPCVLSLPQDDHERLLVKILEEAGITIEWNTQLLRFNDDGNRVSATLSKNGGEESADFAIVCGCDGTRSTVRQGLGLDFPGGTYDEIFYVADVQATGPTIDQQVNICLSAHTLSLAFPVRSTGMARLIGIVPMELGDRLNVTFDQLRPYVKKQMDVDVQKVNWFSTYHVHHRVAEHFRRGRVFIAGDASHIHSPAGGQGMNTGIGDAVNLAWKLAAVIRRQADASIFDTYDSERVGFARWLVSTTDRLFETVIGSGLKSKLVRAVFVPYLAPLLFRLGSIRRGQFRLVSQIHIQYRDSALSSGRAGKISGGDRLPWLSQQDNYKPLESLDWQIHVYGTAGDGLIAFCKKRDMPVHCFPWSEAAAKAGFSRDAIYLIRPDGHIALALPGQNIEAIGKFIEDRKIGVRE